jgi:hypothetical protein
MNGCAERYIRSAEESCTVAKDAVLSFGFVFDELVFNGLLFNELVSESLGLRSGKRCRFQSGAAFESLVFQFIHARRLKDQS